MALLDCIDERKYSVYNIALYDDYFEETIKVTEKAIIGMTRCQRVSESAVVILPTREEVKAAEYILKKNMGKITPNVVVLILDELVGEIVEFSHSQEILVILVQNVNHKLLKVPEISIVIDSCRELDNKKRVLISRDTSKRNCSLVSNAANGVCLRIISDAQLKSLLDHRIPSILGSPSVIPILSLLIYGISDISSISLVDPPDPIAIENLMDDLNLLGAVEVKTSSFMITQLGQFLLEMNLDSSLSATLYHSLSGCSIEVCSIISALNSDDLLFKFNKQGKDLNFKENLLHGCDDWNEAVLYFSKNYLFDPALLQLGGIMQVLFIYRQYSLIYCGKHYLFEGDLDTLNCIECGKFKKAWAKRHSINSAKLYSAIIYNGQLTRELSEVSQIKGNSIIPKKILQKEKLFAFLAALACIDSPNQALASKFSNTISALSLIREVVHREYSKIHQQINNCFFRGFPTNLVKSKDPMATGYGFKHLIEGNTILAHQADRNILNVCHLPLKYVFYYELVGNFMKYIIPIQEHYTLENLTLYQTRESIEETGFKHIELDMPSPVVLNILVSNDHNNTLNVDFDEGRIYTITTSQNEEETRRNHSQKIHNIKQALIENCQFNLTYIQNLVIRIQAGGSIASIQYRKDYQSIGKLKYIKHYNKPSKILQDLKNLAGNSLFTLEYHNEDLTSTVYLNNEKAAISFEENLKIQPVPGVYEPINTMKFLPSRQESSITIKCVFTNAKSQEAISVFLNIFGTIFKIDYKNSKERTEVAVKFTSDDDAIKFIQSYKSAQAETKNIVIKSEPIVFQESFSIPMSFNSSVTRIGIMELLEHTARKKEIRLVIINKKKAPRIIFEYRSSANNPLLRFLSIVEPETIILTGLVMNKLKSETVDFKN